MKNIITLFSLSLIILITTGCTRNAATGRLQWDGLSTQQEIALGVEAKPQLIQEYGGEVESAALRNYVTRIGESMAVHTEAEYPDMPWEFTVLDSDVINAFALPGGKVFISRGLIDHMNNEAQLAAVLGHEIGHVTAEHVDERMGRAMGTKVATQIIGAAVGGEGWGQAVPYLVGAGGQAYLLSFGRGQESESDTLGLRYMTKAGYDPQGMVQLLGILVDASGGRSQPEMLSTHPNPDRRRQDVKQIIDEEYQFTQNNSQYQLFADRFRREAQPYLKAPATHGQQTNLGTMPDASHWCHHCPAPGATSLQLSVALGR